MKRFSSIACMTVAVALAAAPVAFAGDMSGMYGNTVVCTAASGAVVKVMVQASGKFTVIRDGKTIQGTWVDSGEQVCYTELDPAPPAGTKPVCTPSALMKPGATWSVTDPGGNVNQCVLKEGTS